MKRKMPGLLTLVLLGLLAGFGPDFAPGLRLSEIENDLVKMLKERLSLYTKHYAPEKIYLQIDKPMYQPGEDLWLSVFVTDAQTLKPSPVSEIVHVELISPKGSVEKTIKLICNKGRAAGDFQFSPEMPGGIYKIRAYTNWMKNLGEDNCFEREIQVQSVVLPNLKMKLDFPKKGYGPGETINAKLDVNTNENKPLKSQAIDYALMLDGKQISAGKLKTDADGSQLIRVKLPENLSSNDVLLNVRIPFNSGIESISRSVPVVLNKLDIGFFPEGGDLVNGLGNRVAFKARNESGKPCDIEGKIVDKKGNVVTEFKSLHAGMGVFDLKPVTGEKYEMVVTTPAGIREKFALPDAWDRGYAIQADNVEPSLLKMKIHSTEDEALTLVAQVRDRILYSTVIAANAGVNELSFSTAQFPIGVARLTLFDSKGIERAERLVFVNAHKKMQISIETNKEKFLPRGKVSVTVKVRDERGMPMPALLSMAVVNDQFLSFADSKDGHLLSKLLLEDELKEKVFEPTFYFDEKNPLSAKALDHLLLTSGWRHFKWEKMMEQVPAPLTFQPEKTLIKGTVLDAFSGKPLQNAALKKSGQVLGITDEQGRFAFNYALYEDLNLSVEAEGYQAGSCWFNDYGQARTIHLYRPSQRVYEKRVSSSVQAHDLVVAEQMALPAAMNLTAVGAASYVFEPPMAKPANGVAAMDDMVLKEEIISTGDEAFIAKRKAARSEDEEMEEPVRRESRYKRVREFPQRKYDQATDTKRSDFRNTIFWNPLIEIDHSGKKTIEFFANDDITSFRITVEGISKSGDPGRAEALFYTQLPLQMKIKMPLEFTSGDKLMIPLTLSNNSDKPIGGKLTITEGDGLSIASKPATEQILMPGEVKTLMVEALAKPVTGTFALSANLDACGFSDAFSSEYKISARGFPVQLSYSGQDRDKRFRFGLNQPVAGSVRIAVSAYPSVVSDLVKGVEGILQEPSGCFEQTSCTAYPNAMVLDYLKHTGSSDRRILARAEELLERGYKRLTTFEASNKGYEWFGANPAHEGLTAYGIMEFTDMKRAGQQVDEKMMERTTNWLFSHRDGRGGFAREKRALHDFGSVSDEVLNGYIVYALADAGHTGISAEFESANARALSSGDPYLLAMNANAAFSLRQNKKAVELLQRLLPQQLQDGSFNGKSHSITFSQGKSLKIETTALAILAMLQSPQHDRLAMQKAIQFIVASRDGSGTFSSTQGTILALKALTAFAKHSKKTKEDGQLRIYIDDRIVKQVNFKAGDQEVIEVAGLEQFLTAGSEHQIRVQYALCEEPLPYAVSVKYNTSLPQSAPECKLSIACETVHKEVKLGETLRLNVKLRNLSAEGVPSSMALVGLPAGLSVQSWQLKELQEKAVFDYYEIKGNILALYYRGLPPGAEKLISLDLRAEFAGESEAQASGAYLYYTNEFKNWCALPRILVKS